MIRRLSFIFLLAAVFASRSGAADALPSPPPAATYAKAVSLFESKDYRAALPLFQQVVREEPRNARAHYYLGSCQETVGDMEGEALHYYISDRLSPDPGMKAYADKVMAGLPLENQEWVENRLAAFFRPAPDLTASPKAKVPARAGDFGLRLSTRLALFNLSDFQDELSSIANVVQGYEAANPGYGYKFQSSIPSLGAVLELNPYFTTGPDSEWGVAFALWPAASVTYDLTDSIDPNYFVRSEWNLTSFELLAKGRVYFSGKSGKPVRFYLEPSAGFQPIYIHWTDDYQRTTATPSSNQIGWDTTSTAFDAGLNFGAVVNAGRGFLVCFSTGYQLDDVSGFQATWKDSGVPSMNGAKGTLQMYRDPSTGRRYLTFVPDDPSLLSAFGEDSSIWNYCKPLNVDLSGFRFDVDVSYTFS